MFKYGIVRFNKKNTKDPVIQFNEVLAILKDPQNNTNISVVYKDNKNSVQRKIFSLNRFDLDILQKGNMLVE